MLELFWSAVSLLAILTSPYIFIHEYPLRRTLHGYGNWVSPFLVDAFTSFHGSSYASHGSDGSCHVTPWKLWKPWDILRLPWKDACLREQNTLCSWVGT